MFFLKTFTTLSVTIATKKAAGIHEVNILWSV